MAKVDGSMMQIKVTTSSATGSFHDLAQYITDFSGLEILADLVESHTFGDAWVEQSYTGFKRVGDITLSGFYDDVAASGPHAIFGQSSDLGAERVMKINLGTTNAYPKFDFLVASYKRMPTRGELTRYEVVIKPTGALTVATT